ncbi:hypothetical protein RhiirA5_407862 [Rhizophagus irregularis]|uniref:Uncharacterized protein n=2 Tax=Rhizophagus irregularis TaxID=588596 RepID=A0A2N0Q9L1_9GLOM|nr:hypothetical protein RhiirA5_407862 [Rhizophagus irregularis]
MIYTGMVKDIRKFIDNLCESALEAAWSFNYAHKTIFQDTTHMIEEKIHQILETHKQFATNFRDYERKEI